MILNDDKRGLAVWLAKVPKYLGEKIMSLPKETVVGSLVISKDGSSGKPSVQIKLSEALRSSGIPSQHIVDIKDRESGMYIVNSSANGVSIAGSVNKECFIRPVINAEYLRYKRSIKASAEGTESKVKVLDYFAEVKRSAKYSSLREMEILARKRKAMLQSKKRERLDKDDIMEIVFKAFEKHDNWTVRDLADFSGQPVAYIQEIVSEICVLNKRDHKNSYELKPEYKQRSQ